MKNKKPNAELVWKQLEDLLAPRLRFSIRWLARNIRLSTGPVREAVRRLVAQGAMRLVQRSKAGHVVEVRLPEEIRPERVNGIESRTGGEDEAGAGAAINIEEADFLQNTTLRKAIHARERGQCFYCLRRTSTAVQCLDHVVPRVEMGCNSYRNLVSSCIECNSQKGEKPANDFLRRLYREGHLNASELAARLRALEALASGKLRPPLAAVAKPAAK